MKKLFLILALSIAAQSTELQAMQFFKKVFTFKWLFGKKKHHEIDIKKLNQDGFSVLKEAVKETDEWSDAEVLENSEKLTNDKSILSQSQMLISFREEKSFDETEWSDSQANLSEPDLEKSWPFYDSSSDESSDEEDDSWYPCSEKFEKIEDVSTKNMEPAEKPKEFCFKINFDPRCPIKPTAATNAIKKLLQNYPGISSGEQNILYTPKSTKELRLYEEPVMVEKKPQIEPDPKLASYAEELAEYVKKQETFESNPKTAEFHIHDRNPLYPAPNKGLTPDEYFVSCKLIKNLSKEELNLKEYAKKQESYQHYNKNKNVHFGPRTTKSHKKRKKKTRKKRYIIIDVNGFDRF